jgi:hypothetical protein
MIPNKMNIKCENCIFFTKEPTDCYCPDSPFYKKGNEILWTAENCSCFKQKYES